MSRSSRKLVGTIVMIVFVLAYIMVVLAIAPRILATTPGHWQWLFYIVAGMAWILPLMPLIRWMERRDPGDIA